MLAIRSAQDLLECPDDPTGHAGLQTSISKAQSLTGSSEFNVGPATLKRAGIEKVAAKGRILGRCWNMTWKYLENWL